MGLALGIVFLTAFPALEAGAVCETAYNKCMARALVAGVLSMNLLQLVYSVSSCTLGYEFCLLYYESNKY